MACCNCCCPDGEECCKAPGPDGICCTSEKCCGTSGSPACCGEFEQCCNETCCAETVECCGDPGVCCLEGQYCCDGVCEDVPCEERECCNQDGSCSNFCPFPVCDNNPAPGATPDGGPCCDEVCVECGDCGDGGEECCNSIELASIFDPLSDQSESIACELADSEVSAEFGAAAVSAWAEYAAPRRFGEVYKFSLMRRSYVLDALYAIEGGAVAGEAMAATRQQWALFANQYRGVING